MRKGVQKLYDSIDIITQCRTIYDTILEEYPERLFKKQYRECDPEHNLRYMIFCLDRKKVHKLLGDHGYFQYEVVQGPFTLLTSSERLYSQIQSSVSDFCHESEKPELLKKFIVRQKEFNQKQHNVYKIRSIDRKFLLPVAEDFKRTAGFKIYHSKCLLGYLNNPWKKKK